MTEFTHMDHERITTYLRSLEGDDHELINDIEAFASENQIPIAKRETVSFLQTMIKIKSPLRVLEVGTAIGYSTIFMAMAAPEGAEIVSIEKSENNYRMAIENTKKAEAAGLTRGRRLTLVYGDASDELDRLEGCFDLVFMDAAKAQYIVWLPRILELLSEGGVLISDNVFQEETIFESKFVIERRDRTIHKRMRQYLFELKHSEWLTTSLLPVGDGVALSVYNKGNTHE